MIIIEGRYNTAKVFTSEVESSAYKQIETLVNQPFVQGSVIRIMPDVHAGAGSTIGTTMTLQDKVVPNLVGVDIGCGMLTTKLANDYIDFKVLDRVIRQEIPSGFAVRKHPHEFFKRVDIEALKIREGTKNDRQLDLQRAGLSIGTLGGGNHFIEINKDEAGHHYLVIHSGSRNIGLQVALMYQRKATKLKPDLPKDLAYLEGPLFDDYLHDMKIIQNFALQNRLAMAQVILKEMNWTVVDQFSTVHNYIDVEHQILRKGAVSAQKGERLLIPLNMRDGSLICIGKGNPDWNYSAPHGAGRILSRTAARQQLSLAEFEKIMDGIWSTSIRKSTLDESPMAYKDLEHLLEYLHETVDIEHYLKPVYNFKAN